MLRKKEAVSPALVEQLDRHEHTHTHTDHGWPHPLSAQASHTQNAKNCTISSGVARSRISMMSHFVTASLAGGFLLPCGFFLIGRSARCACGTRAVRRCHLQRAQRGRQCKQCRGNGRGADAYAGGVRRDGERGGYGHGRVRQHHLQREQLHRRAGRPGLHSASSWRSCCPSDLSTPCCGTAP